jgi:hypothetical protein
MGGAMTRLRMLAALGAVAATATLGALAPPAQAHDACVSFSARGTACNRAGHVDAIIDGCDAYSDGQRVRAWWTLAEVSGDNIGDFDPNGASPGCAHNYNYGNFHLTRHRICVEIFGCSSWLYH